MVDGDGGVQLLQLQARYNPRIPGECPDRVPNRQVARSNPAPACSSSPFSRTNTSLTTFSASSPVSTLYDHTRSPDRASSMRLNPASVASLSQTFYSIVKLPKLLKALALPAHVLQAFERIRSLYPLVHLRIINGPLALMILQVNI